MSERLAGRLHRLEQILELMLPLEHGLVLSGDLSGALVRFLEGVCQAMGYEAAALYLEERGEIASAAVPTGFHPLASVGGEARFRFIERPSVVAGAENALMVVPLRDEQQWVGSLVCAGEGVVLEEDVPVWETVAPHLANAIANAHLFVWTNEARDRLSVLYEISRRLSLEIDLDVLLRDLLKMVMLLVGAEEGNLHLLDAQGYRVQGLYYHDGRAEPEAFDAKYLDRLLGEGLLGWVLTHRKGALVEDTRKDPRWLDVPQTAHVRSVLAVPIRHGDRVHGVIFLSHSQPGRFHREHLDLVTSVADQAAVAVENARLVDQVRRQVTELAVINEVSQASESLDLNEVASLSVERVAEAMNVDRCLLFMLGESGDRLTLMAAFDRERGVMPEVGQYYPLAAWPHIVEALEQRSVLHIDDFQHHADLGVPREREFFAGIASGLLIPLWGKQGAIGVLGLERREGKPDFTEAEIALGGRIARQVAVALENARLYKRASYQAERLRLINELGTELTGILEIQVLLWEVVRLLRETIDCYHVSIGLVEGDELVFMADVDEYYNQGVITGLRLRVGEEGINGWVVQTGKSLLVEDVLRDPRYYAVEALPDTRCELAVPIKVRDQVIGVLDIQSREVGAFGQEEVAFLEALAAQVAVAVENARLFGEVEEERATLEAIFDGSGDAIVVTDEEGRILRLNPAARSFFNMGNGEVEGRLLTDVVVNEDVRAVWAHPLQPGESYATEIALEDGRTLYGSVTAIPRLGRVGVFQDITYLKELDRMKSEFVSTVSHDLRSPLQAIQSSAELIARAGPLNADQRQAVQYIQAVVRRLSELVGDLLDLGRIETGVEMTPEPCHLDEILARAVAEIRRPIEEKGLEFSLELPPVLPAVMGNPLRLEQVFANLLSNAIKYTPAGSVTLRAEVKEDEVLVSVSDTGIGIAPEDLPHIFEKFYRVKNPLTRGIEGTGLGLAIVKTIVEGFGGRVWAESVPRLGSTFYVALPRADG